MNFGCVCKVGMGPQLGLSNKIEVGGWNYQLFEKFDVQTGLGLMHEGLWDPSFVTCSCWMDGSIAAHSVVNVYFAILSPQIFQALNISKTRVSTSICSA